MTERRVGEGVRPPARDRNPIAEATREIEEAESSILEEQAQVHATLAVAWAGLANWTQQQEVLESAKIATCPHPPSMRTTQPYIEGGRAGTRLLCGQCGQEVSRS